MSGNSKRNVRLGQTLFVLLSVVVFFWLIAAFDVYEWFYEHSRRYEAYQYDELIISLFFLIIIGLLWLAGHLYWKAVRVLSGSERKNPPSRTDRVDYLQLPSKSIGLSSDVYKSPLLLLISLIAVIIAAESLDMIILHSISFSSVYYETLADVVVLVLMVTPALYFIFLRPMHQQILIRKKVEEDMQKLNLRLEKKVEQRTAELKNKLAEQKRIEAKLIGHQKQLRALSARLSIAEEKERQRISSELHDNIGHFLALANNRFGILRQLLTGDQERKMLEDIQGFMTEAIRFSRSLSSELGSSMLNYLPFVSSIKWLAEDIIECNGLVVKIQVQGTPELPAGDSRMIFLKAIREILVNVIKHAKANTVEISVYTESENIIVKIKDDGIGFDVDKILPSASRNWQGFGIFNVQERMADIKGTVLITSEPGQGTELILSKPYIKNEKVNIHEKN